MFQSHPSADSYRNYALLPLGAAKHREAQKQSAYRDLAEKDVEFHPFVVESTGAFGDSANQVLDILISHLLDSLLSRYGNRYWLVPSLFLFRGAMPIFSRRGSNSQTLTPTTSWWAGSELCSTGCEDSTGLSALRCSDIRLDSSSAVVNSRHRL